MQQRDGRGREVGRADRKKERWTSNLWTRTGLGKKDGASDVDSRGEAGARQRQRQRRRQGGGKLSEN